MASGTRPLPAGPTWRDRARLWFGKPKTLEAMYGYLFILPMIIGLLGFVLGPIIASAVISFSKTSLMSAGEWIAFGNYRKLLFEDWLFWKAMRNSFAYALVVVPVTTVLQLVLAAALNRGLRGVSVFRALFYLPAITPSVAISMLWVFIFNPQFGLANLLLQSVGLPRQLWLSSTKTALSSIILMAIWGGIGPGMVMFLAGLQSISETYYEAAEIDGAGALAKFWNITVPLVSPVTFLSIVMGMIGALQVFDAIYIATNGGPRYATLSVGLYIFQNAFSLLRFGFASAIAWVLAVIVFALTYVQFVLQKRWVHYGG